MSSQASRSIPSIGETFGVLYVGATIAAILFGITNLQMVVYYKNYPNDSSLYRYSVALLWVLDALHVALTTHALYFYLIDMFGDLAGALVHSVWSFKVQLGMNVATVVYVQGLYAIRLWKLGRHFHKFLPWFVFLSVTASLGVAIVATYGFSITPNFSNISNIKIYIHAVFSMVSATDILVALMMCYYLHKSRADMNFPNMASRLLNLMRLIIVSGLATSACSLLTLISFVVWPDTLIFLGIVFILPKLYVNSLLAMFNYRPKHESSKPNAQCTRRHSMSAVLQFAPHISETSARVTTVSSLPPLEIQEIRSFGNKLDP